MNVCVNPFVVAYGAAMDRAKRERREFRVMIDRSGLTACQKLFLKDLVNLWIVHRNDAGFIHPGRERLARKHRKTIKSVSRAFALFRDMGFVKAVAYEAGGMGKATCYTVDLEAIRRRFAPSTVKAADGQIVPFRARSSETVLAQNVPVSDAQNVPVTAGQNVPLSYVDTLGCSDGFGEASVEGSE